MLGPDLYETPDGRPLAVHVSDGGDLREYLYGEFDDFEDDLGDVCGTCGGHDGEYEECTFGSPDSPYIPGPEPGTPGLLGCPYMTGTF
jgi:hypothetical protein